MQGPYKSNKWQERWSSIEGILLIAWILLQTISVVITAFVIGAEWLADDQYLKFIVIFGVAACMIVLHTVTRAPLFLFGLFAVICAGYLWR
jgi:hypothetical protein